MTRVRTSREDISGLLSAAQRAAARELGQVPATQDNLDLLAAHVHKFVMLQVIAGAWAGASVTDVRDLMGMRVTARLGRPLHSEPDVKVEYDFTRTRLPLLLVEQLRN